jgi:hypothetical protein
MPHTCVTCKRKIKSSESNLSVGDKRPDKLGKRYYFCLPCEENGSLDKWCDQNKDKVD